MTHNHNVTNNILTNNAGNTVATKPCGNDSAATIVRNILMLLIMLCGINSAAWADVTKSIWDGTVATAFDSGKGTKEDPYVISTPQQFAYFAQNMNGKTYYVKLAASIELDLDGTNRVWTYGQNGATFKGHFDGNGSTISNMKFVVNAKGKSWGLFPNLQGSSATNHAEIRNLTIKDFTITTPATGSYSGANIGLLVGKANGNTDIRNITVTGGSIKVDVETQGVYNVAAVAGQLEKGENNIKDCSVSEVGITSGTAKKMEYYVGGITGNASNYAVITGNSVSNLTITIGGYTNKNNIIGGGLIGKITGVSSTAATGFPMGKRSLVQKNTVTSPEITMNGYVEGASLELGGLIGLISFHTNAFNNKVTSPAISITNDIKASSYVGGAVGYLDRQAFIDGVTVDGTGSITGPTTDKTVKNNIAFFVGGFLGYQNSSNSSDNTNFDANKFKNIAVTGMSINLAHYLPQSTIHNHKFSVGGIAGSINQPKMSKDYTWGGMPENLIFKGGKIYAPWASTSPTVSNFNSGAADYQNMTPDVVTTIDAIEKAKVNTWYYNDYKLGLSNEFLASGSVKDNGADPKQFEFRKNYTRKLTNVDGVQYLSFDKTQNDDVLIKSNRYLDSERDSKTVLWWTQQAKMDKSKGDYAAVTCFTKNEQPIYPQSGATPAQAGNLVDYPHYMYFFQGVSNATYASDTDAGKIVAGIEANFTNNIVPSIVVPTVVAGSMSAGNSADGSLVGDGISVTITNDGETKRGFDPRTLTVALKKTDGTAATGSYTYQWYVDGKAAGTGPTEKLTPHWKDGLGVTVNVLNGGTIVATASYGLAPGVMHTRNSYRVDAATAEKIRSDFNSRGTSANPYIIDCENALRQLSYLSTAHTLTSWETLSAPVAPYPTNQPQGHYNRAYYELVADIDLDNVYFTPISHVGYSSDDKYGTCHPNWIFQGVFDGMGRKISNFKITWGASQYVNNNANLYYGLFGAVGGAAATRKWGDAAPGNTVIKNLIIYGATLEHNTAETSFYYNQSISTKISSNCFVGVLAGIVSSNTTVQNIEIRGSKITDEGSDDYRLALRGLYVGGAIGGVQHAINTTTPATASLEIQHIAAQVDITLTKPVFNDATKEAQLGLFNVGGIIGRYCATSAQYDQAKASMPKYTIYSGTVDAPKAWVSPVLGALLYASQKDVKFVNYSKQWEGNNNSATTQIPIDSALYYNFTIGTTKITETTPANTCGHGARTMSAHTDGKESAKGYSAANYQGVNYGARYVGIEGASLEFMNGAPFENYNWVWDDGFVHMSTDKYVEARISRDGDTFTATLVGATATSYKWQATFDGTNWIDITSATEATYTAPKSLKPKYIVAFVSDGTTDGGEPKYYRTLVELVEPDMTLVNPSVTVTQSNDKKQYTFNSGAKGDVSHLTITKEWYYSKTQANDPQHNPESTDDTWTPSQASIQNGIVWCKVIVKELGVTVYEDLLMSGATIVYVDAAGGEDNKDGKTERGWTRETAVKTLDHANSLLKPEKEGGTMESNVIVIKGTLNSSGEFRSKGSNPATISGKWDDTEANTGKIILVKTINEQKVNPGDGKNNGHHNYVSAATKFENLIFEPAATDGNADNLFIECHGHDVWFGKGIKMGNFRNLDTSHGNLDTDKQTIPELSIILTATNHRNPGGLYNKVKPQVITIESGHYGRILGGRYTRDFFDGKGYDGNDSHAIQGSAEQPAWAVINIDIDENNQMTSADGKTTYTCDVNCIIAGLTDGSAYGDYEINIKGGNVRYIVGANQGNGVANGTATYTPVGGISGAFGQWPNSSFFGRTVINVDKTPGSNGKDITIDNVYAGGLGRYSGAVNAVVDMYIYGHTEVNVRNGTIIGSLYGGGAGGVLGRNPWDAHVPYKTDVKGTDVTHAIINGVQYGDIRQGTWSSLDPATAEMAKVKLHNLKEDGTYATEELDLAKSSTTINISGGTIGGSVYGGGDGFVSNMPAELTMQGVGSVFGTTNINITGGSIGGSVYGGSKGSEKYFRFSVKGTGNKDKTYDTNVYGQVITHIAEMNGTVNLNITGTEDVYPTIYGHIYGAGKGVATQYRIATKADVAAGVRVEEGQTYSEEYADIARTGNSSLGEQFKSTININIDLPDSHPFTNNIYGGGEMGKVDGNIYVNIKNGVINGNIFGAGLGEAGHTETKAIETKAMVTGNTYVNMINAKVNASAVAGTGNVYGGGQLGKVFGNTNVNMEDGVIENNVYGGGLEGTVSALAKVTLVGSHVHGSVFGGGDKAVVGTAATGDELSEGDARKAWAKANGTSVVMSGESARVFGDIFGGGNEAMVEGNTSVYLYNGEFGGNIFGGGNGKLDNHKPEKFADVTNNTSVYVDGTNVMWSSLWDKENKKVVEWDGTWNHVNRGRFVEGTEKEPVFKTPHNIYGGGNLACRVAGNDSVFIVKGFANAELLSTDVWKNSFYDNNNPHFYVFGGGYGPFTTAKNTYVNVGVLGEYEDATTTEQLAKKFLANFMEDGGNDKLNLRAQNSPAKAKGSYIIDKETKDAVNAGDPDASIGVYDNSFGIPLYTVLGVLGGGYSGLISGNTNVTVGGDTFIHRVYGGGYGSSVDYGRLFDATPSAFAKGLAAGTAAYDAYKDDSRLLKDILGEVGGKTDVTVNGAFIYGDVFGGGAGVESVKSSSGDATTDFVDMARVRGNNVAATDAITKVTISDIAQIYGSVYGGGDIANVGASGAELATGEPSYTPADGVTPASLTNVRSFVNVIGGDIYGEVFGGGGGRQFHTLNDAGTGFVKTTADEDVLGRVEGNTLVHIANTPAAQSLTGQDVEPNIWQRIYGGGNLGSVNGNTKVWVEGGNIGHNIIGGGNGYAADDSPQSQTHGTYANVYGNTNITIDGGSVIWDKSADSQGNVTTWTNARKQLIKTEKEMRQLFVSRPDSIRELLVPYLDKRFFDYAEGDHSKMKFPINHNIYGGGRYACHVGTYNKEGVLVGNTGKSTVTLNHSLITDEDFLDIRTVAGLCWYSTVNNTSEPQFSVFGGGYGANTKVGATQIDGQIGRSDVNYISKEADAAAWNSYEAGLRSDWAGVSEQDKTLLYGGTNENAYRRYRTVRYALSLGVPNHTYMNVYGGGYSGYVAGDTKVNVNGTIGVRNVYGGGLGAVKDRSVVHTLADDGELVEASLLKGGDTTASSLDYGKVGGNTDVDIKGGIISLNVYGGGAGVESRYLKAGALSTEADGGTLTDFPLMAHVAGKTNVTITGTVTEVDGHSIDGTVIYGKVFGGGDVANVGTIGTTADAIDWETANPASQSYVSSVTVDGGLVMSHILAGGSGRAKAECHDYETLGGIYGNSRVIIKDNANPSYSPWLWNNIYGGGENGTVYGNSLVSISGGKLGYNIFGGGWGDINDSEGIADDKRVSRANIKRNTFVDITGGEYVLTQMWNEQTRSWGVNNQYNSPQFDYETKKFLINHNIYGGGNYACEIGGSTWVRMTKGLLKSDTQVTYGGGAGNLFATDEWRDVYNKTGSPHFSVYGGGFGANTNIAGNTNLDIALAGDKHISSAPSVTDHDQLYSHFFSEQAIMDITGGGYSGSVGGKAHVKIGGDTFARRILGGGFYGSVGETLIDITSVDCSDIFGGGLMGNIGTKGDSAPSGKALTSGKGVATVNLGTSTGGAANDRIWIHRDLYGANDVSGSIYSAANINIYGGHILGNVYGAGNGNYLYAQGDKDIRQVTVNEYYKTAETTYDLVYTVPAERLSSAVNSSPEAERMVNVNSYRPATQNVRINLQGASDSKVEIRGNVFGGGNSATVNEIYGGTPPTVNVNIGSYLTIGGVYLGCDGDAMFDDKTNYMNAYQDVNRVDLTHAIDWVNVPGNKAVSTQYLPVEENDRPKVYRTNLDLYFQPVEMAVQPTVTWNNVEDGDVTSTTIGTFVCGGNRGNMNVKPNDITGKIVDITFPAGLIIKDKIVGGCNNANIMYKNTHHEGGYLLGKRNPTAASASGNNDIALTVKCQFLPSTGAESGVREGGNVYGGCYKSGTINGDIFVDVQTNMLANVTKDELKANKEKDGVALANVYGAGYGNDSYVYGNTTVLFGKGMKKTPAASPAKGMKPSAPAVNAVANAVVESGAGANFIYGGGQQGNLIGNSLVRIYNGNIASSVCGGSYAGYMWGSTQVLVGYPKYYTCQKSGIYNLKRADKWNTSYKHYAEVPAEGEDVIKQKIYLMKGDVVSEEVFQAIAAYDTSQATHGDGKNFSEAVETLPKTHGGLDGWNDVDINIAEAVYGGGYSLASGSSVAAGTYTVKKYDESQNLNSELSLADLSELNTINNGKGSKGFGGNTTVLVWDRAAAPTDGSTDKDHIAISTQSMKEVTLPEGTDLFGYYYNDNGTYRYIYQEDTYFYGNDKHDGKTYYKNVWESDSEGGMYGDGHLSFAEGFRAGEINGYGFAGANPNGAKMINTFQRMDILRVQDCSLALLGARDYTVTELSTTPYSIARVGELQMRSPGVTLTSNNLTATSEKRSRNYIGFSNNIHYIGAVDSDVPFTDDYHYGNKDNDHTSGTVKSSTSYRAEKQDYIDKYKDKKIQESEFQKRNDGTAKNMIGIASGYAMKLQNVYTTDDKNTEDIFYGPIVGVVEMNLINVREDEGGGYVYADNVHHRASDGSVPDHIDQTEDFLETSGNFVFPYDKTRNRYIVDDCFPVNYYTTNNSGTGPADDTKEKGIHYWYVTGYNYYYNAHITGYTYDSSGSGKALVFNSDNKDGLMVLAGTKEGQKVYLQSVKWRSRHNTDAGFVACDLETEKAEGSKADGFGNHANSSTDGHYVYNHYNLHIGTSNNEGKYATYNAYKLAAGTVLAGYYTDEACTKSAEGTADGTTTYYKPATYWNNLPLTENLGTSQTGREFTNTLTTPDPAISFQLTDAVDNSGNEYYAKYMAQPCEATVVLTAPALSPQAATEDDVSDGKATEVGQMIDKPTMGYAPIQNFFIRTGEGTDANPYVYSQVADGQNLSSGTTYYYFGNGNDYHPIQTSKLYYFDTSDNQYKTASGTITTGSMTYYDYTERLFTYTIYLTIDYVLGPSYTGNLKVYNCALPGEMIKIDKGNIKLTGDQTFSQSGTT